MINGNPNAWGTPLETGKGDWRFGPHPGNRHHPLFEVNLVGIDNPSESPTPLRLAGTYGDPGEVDLPWEGGTDRTKSDHESTWFPVEDGRAVSKNPISFEPANLGVSGESSLPGPSLNSRNRLSGETDPGVRISLETAENEGLRVIPETLSKAEPLVLSGIHRGFRNDPIRVSDSDRTPPTLVPVWPQAGSETGSIRFGP